MLLYYAADFPIPLATSRELVSYFVTVGANVNCIDFYDETPLIFSASHFGIPNAVWMQTLLENGADITATDGYGRGALSLSFRECSDCDHTTYQPMIYEIVKEKVSLLLKAGCDPTSVDDYDFTPSHYARRAKLLDLWKSLLDSAGYEAEAILPEFGDDEDTESVPPYSSAISVSSVMRIAFVGDSRQQ
jgi:ankyrin repeat protein